MSGISSKAAGKLENRYKFGGKEIQHGEFSDGSGLEQYDFGAREYDPQIGRWGMLDKLSDKYFNLSPYSFVANKPTIAIDPDGKRIIFVNGYLGFGSSIGGATYWNGRNSAFVTGAEKYFSDKNTPFFTNFEFSYISSSTPIRRSEGSAYAKQHYAELIAGLDIKKDVFRFVSHSMGGAFAEGMVDYLKAMGWKVDATVHLDIWEPTELKPNKDKVDGVGTTLIDGTITNDPVQGLSVGLDGDRDIPDADIRVRKKSDLEFQYRHRDLIDSGAEFWNTLLPAAVQDFFEKLHRYNNDKKQQNFFNYAVNIQREERGSILTNYILE
jgi:RHS repeat-associated protein